MKTQVNCSLQRESVEWTVRLSVGQRAGSRGAGRDRILVGGVHGNKCCGLLYLPDSLTFTGPLPRRFARVHFWPTVEMRDWVFRRELFG